MIELLIYFVGVISAFFAFCYYENKSTGYIERWNIPLFCLFSIFSWFMIFCLFFYLAMYYIAKKIFNIK